MNGFLKIIEVLMLWRIKQHLVNHNILVPKQYSSQDGVATDTAIYKFTETIFSAWNKK